jgi:hypothetical protein
MGDMLDPSRQIGAVTREVHYLAQAMTTESANQILNARER